VSDKKKKNDKIHTGINLIWNDIFLCSENALIIRHGIINKLKETDIKLEKEWGDVIDELVYTRVGYRMVGSDKMIDGVPENRPLKLLFIMNFNGELRDAYYERLSKDTKALVLETSIRNVIDTYKESGMRIKIPGWIPENLIKDIKVSDGSCKFSVASSREHNFIEKFIREKLPKVYSRVQITLIKRYSDNNMIICPKTRHCLNIGREHSSCGIFFFASPAGMYQKCLCPCNKLNGRKKGYCKDFTSECFPFDEETRKTLFPNSTVYNFKEETVLCTPKNNAKMNKIVCNKLLSDILS